jgi:hypothetical protein
MPFQLEPCETSSKVTRLHILLTFEHLGLLSLVNRFDRLLFVADSGNSRVQVLTTLGEFQNCIGHGVMVFPVHCD